MHKLDYWSSNDPSSWFLFCQAQNEDGWGSFVCQETSSFFAFENVLRSLHPHCSAIFIMGFSRRPKKPLTFFQHLKFIHLCIYLIHFAPCCLVAVSWWHFWINQSHRQNRWNNKDGWRRIMNWLMALLPTLTAGSIAFPFGLLINRTTHLFPSNLPSASQTLKVCSLNTFLSCIDLTDFVQCRLKRTKMTGR